MLDILIPTMEREMLRLNLKFCPMVFMLAPLILFQLFTTSPMLLLQYLDL